MYKLYENHFLLLEKVHANQFLNQFFILHNMHENQFSTSNTTLIDY